MKTFKFYKNILLVILVGLILSWNLLSADEEVLINTDEKAKDILLSHDWECKWKDQYFSGTNKVVYEEVSLKKVTAKVKNSNCPDGWGKFKGKYKNGRLTGKSSSFPSPCQGSVTGIGKLYKSADGGYYSKGSYRPSGYNAKGESNCVAVPK